MAKKPGPARSPIFSFTKSPARPEARFSASQKSPARPEARKSELKPARSPINSSPSHPYPYRPTAIRDLRIISVDRKNKPQIPVWRPIFSFINTMCKVAFYDLFHPIRFQGVSARGPIFCSFCSTARPKARFSIPQKARLGPRAKSLLDTRCKCFVYSCLIIVIVYRFLI